MKTIKTINGNEVPVDSGFILYLIKCVEKKHVYVGFSSQYPTRIQNQQTGKGSNFVTMFGFKEAVPLAWYDNLDAVTQATKDTVEKLKEKKFSVQIESANPNLIAVQTADGIVFHNKPQKVKKKRNSENPYGRMKNLWST